jgi:hypothetical protein
LPEIHHERGGKAVSQAPVHHGRYGHCRRMNFEMHGFFGRAETGRDRALAV